MSDLTLYTYDWVPEPPRGYVREIRIRWALEEAKLPYRVKGVPFKDRGAEHVAHQPFAQVPWLASTGRRNIPRVVSTWSAPSRAPRSRRRMRISWRISRR